MNLEIGLLSILLPFTIKGQELISTGDVKDWMQDFESGEPERLFGGADFPCELLKVTWSLHTFLHHIGQNNIHSLLQGALRQAKIRTD